MSIAGKKYLHNKIMIKGFMILMCSFFYGCRENEFNDVHYFEDDSRIQTLNGTWKVISFEDFALERIEFPNQGNSGGLETVITFNDLVTPYTLSGKNTSNNIQADFEYITSRQLKISRLSSTEVTQPEWGDKFSTALQNDAFEFIISENRLRLYYNNRKNSVTFARQ